MEQIRTDAHKIVDNLDTVPEPLTLTDVNDYCKIKIFEHLIWSDLLSCCETNKQLRVAACDVFKRKYGNANIKLFTKFGRFVQYSNGFLDNLHMDRATTLKILRNFGHLFFDVSIHYSMWIIENSCDLKFLRDIECYLAEYCSRSLEKILFEGIRPVRTTPFKMATGIQLPNITTLHTTYCYFARNFSFSENFPNLQSLSLHYHQCNFNIKDWHFPTVKHLHFSYYNYPSQLDAECSDEIYHSNDIDLIEMLKRNKQLEKLELFIDKKSLVSIGKCLNEYLPKLHSLCLILYKLEPSSFEPIHLENITDFYLFVQHSIQSIPFTFNRLECFKLCAPKNLWGPPNFVLPNFIFQNKFLKSIDVCGTDERDVIKLFQLENILSNVEVLCICAYGNISSDSVENFLTQNQSLKLLRICGIDDMSDTIKTKISGKKMHRRVHRYIEPELIFGKTEATTSTKYFYPSVFNYVFDQNIFN